MKHFILTAATVVFAATSFAQPTSASFFGKLKETKISYQGEVSLGFATGNSLTYTDSDGDSGKEKTDFSRPLIETVHGVRITQYGFIGLGLGMQYAYGTIANEFVDNEWNTLLMPVFVNLKGYYPITDDWSPYVTLSLGGSPVLSSAWNHVDGRDEYKLNGGFYCKFGLGVNYKRYIFDFGLMHQSFKYQEFDSGELDYWSLEKFNSFYFNVGIKF